MADAPQGYGPPKVGNFRAVRIAERERALVASPPGAPVPLLRIEIRGEEEFLLRAMPLMIKVGERGYVATEISGDGKTIACFLEEIPAEGTVIRVGYPPDDFTELPERFSLSMIEGAEPVEPAPPTPGGGS